MSTQRLVGVLVVVALLVLGLSAYLTWTSADPGNGRAVVRLDGYDVTRAPLSLALASVVAAVVLQLVGTTTRRVLSALILLHGVVTVVVALRVRPDAAELARLRPELGSVLTDHVEVTIGPAPWLALTGGVFLVAAGVLGLLTASRWARPTARYERRPAAHPQDQWKAIDAGEDPTI